MGFIIAGGVLLSATLIIVIVLSFTGNSTGPRGRKFDPAVVSSRVTALNAEDQNECLKVARVFVDGVINSQNGKVDQSFDNEEFIQRVAEGLDVPSGFRRGFENESRKNGTVLSEAIAEIRAALNQGATYEILRARIVDGQPRVLLRLYGEAVGVNYHELYFHRTKGGKVLIGDIYIFSVGDSFASVMRRVYMMAAAQIDKDFLGRVKGDQGELIANLNKIKQMKELQQSAPKTALTIYHSLPESIKKEKFIQVMRVALAANVDEDEYLKALEDFSRRFPNDPSTDLVAIDFHLLRGEIDQAILALQRLRDSVGGDPVLDEMVSDLRSTSQEHQ